MAHASLQSLEHLNATQQRLSRLLELDAQSARYVSVRERRMTGTVRRLRGLLAIDGCQPVQAFEGAFSRVHVEQSAVVAG